MTKAGRIKDAAEKLIGEGNLEVIPSYFAPDYLAHAENKEYSGLDFIKRFSKTLRTSIPDIKVLTVEILVENGDTVSWLRTLQGTHKKNMMGIPASNKKLTWNEMVVSRFEGDKIAEEWIVSELAGQLMIKLGKQKK